MKYLQLFSIMFLAGIWVSVCWNWYVCQLQDICDSAYSVQSEESPISQQDSIVSEQEMVQTGEVLSLTGSELGTLADAQSGSLSYSSALDAQSAPGLSSSDVLVLTEYNIQSEEKESQEQEDQVSETESATETVADVCSVPLVGPIGLGDENDASEVMRLEAFLNSQGESLVVNGIYESSDVAAVNRFQLAYRAQILDPWGIDAPTGYVYRTTVKTMNEVACGVSYDSEDSQGGEQEQSIDEDDDTASGEAEDTSSGEEEFNSLISDEA